MSEIQRADLKARRNLLIGMVIFALAMLIFSPTFDGLREWLTQDPDSIQQKVPILIGGIFLAFLPLLFFGIYCWGLGRTVIIADRFPPPKMKVVVDTPIVRGKKAQRQGWLLQVTGLLLSTTAIGFPLAFWLVLKSILSEA